MPDFYLKASFPTRKLPPEKKNCLSRRKKICNEQESERRGRKRERKFVEAPRSRKAYAATVLGEAQLRRKLPSKEMPLNLAEKYHSVQHEKHIEETKNANKTQRRFRY